MVEAVFGGQVIARSEATVMVEGNHYFPPESIPVGLPGAVAGEVAVPVEGHRQLLHGGGR